MYKFDDNQNVYVVGDLHGNLEGFEEILEKINFNPEQDFMFCTGDVIDRGVNGVYLMRKYFMDGSGHFNTVLGNHELMMIKSLGGFYQTPKPTVQKIEISADEAEYDNWMNNNGGSITNYAFSWLSKSEKVDFMNFLGLLPLYEQIRIGEEKKFTVVHSALMKDKGHTSKGFYFDEIESSVWWRGNYGSLPELNPGVKVIHGHTPNNKVGICDNGYINIDTGSGHRYGHLTCVKLNDMSFVRTEEKD